jgi:rhomboid family GlyGly-CTERM serine protease
VNFILALITISVICVAGQWPTVSILFEWDHHAIAHQELWRIVTGNFTHTNGAHLAMNLTALWMIALLFKPTSRSLLLSTFSISLVIGIALLYSNLSNYVGLSGVLHGLFAFYALSEWLDGRKNSLLLVIGVMGKVIWEQWAGPSQATSELIHAKIAIQAHLIGLLTGLAIALIVKRYQTANTALKQLNK